MARESDEPLEVDVQMRRLEERSCNLDDADPVTREPFYAKGGKRWTAQGSCSVHRPHDEQIRFTDARNDSGLNGFQIYDSREEMITRGSKSEPSTKKGSGQSRQLRRAG